MTAEGETPDRRRARELVEALEALLLGSAPSLSGPEVADRLQLPLETAKERWRSLGFTTPPDDEPAFTEADVTALELTESLHRLGLVGDDDESAQIRTLGRSYARLAEWQVRLLGRTVDLETMDEEELATVLGEVIPLIEDVQRYVWRRHIVSAAARELLGPGSADEPATAVGFADIVGYTRQSRSLDRDELAGLVEGFESAALRIVGEYGGRIIKTIGDEVLFVADTPEAAAEIGLRLVEGHLADESFPELRVGMAWGQVLHRLGDVFGPVVNVAARLTSVARPGRVLVDRAMADVLHDAMAEREGELPLRLRRLRRTSVKGYRRLEPWNLRRGNDDSVDLPFSAVLAEGRDSIRRAVDELQARTERPAGAEGSQ